MTLAFFRDYQEIFKGCVGYYLLTPNGIVSTTVPNLIASGTNDGTLVNSPGMTGTDMFGKANNCLSFTGSPHILLPTNAFQIQEKSIVVWVYITSSSVMGFMGHSDYQDRGGYALYYHYNPNYYKVGYSDWATNGSTAHQIVSNSNLPLNQWVMITLSRGASSRSIYFNKTVNVTASTTATAGFNASNYVYLARQSYRSGYEWYLNGRMPEVMIFNRALSATEVATIYNLTSRKYLYPVMSGIRGVE